MSWWPLSVGSSQEARRNVVLAFQLSGLSHRRHSAHQTDCSLNLFPFILLTHHAKAQQRLGQHSNIGLQAGWRSSNYPSVQFLISELRVTGVNSWPPWPCCCCIFTWVLICFACKGIPTDNGSLGIENQVVQNRVRMAVRYCCWQRKNQLKD